MSYEELSPGFFRCNLPWPMGIITCPVATFLVKTKTENEWLLVDAGFDFHVKELVQNVASHIGPNGVLSHVFITHAHLDHVAALPKLLETYPNCLVAMHPNEIPFLRDGKRYGSLKGDQLAFNLARMFLQESKVSGIPANRFLEVVGGNVFGGVLEVVETHGHTPGSCSYLHLPSKSLMLGDAIMNFSVFSKCPSCSILSPSTSNMKGAKDSLAKVCAMDVDTYYPAHDQAKGIKKADIESFLKH
ncbi:hypothetical protein HDV03_001162 [Kappamyces sp. JEL0829]|nr:hypothetical protein HDV03_001162 [Kappamyces sp. JEL0829]